jgi:uncharacterized Ntn-hydrolase superfamily protein
VASGKILEDEGVVSQMADATTRKGRRRMSPTASSGSVVNGYAALGAGAYLSGDQLSVASVILSAAKDLTTQTSFQILRFAQNDATVI